MRAVVQRVKWARVCVEGTVTGEIGPGLLVLVGVRDQDGPTDAGYIADKVQGLRVFDDSQGRMNLSVVDAAGSVLVVSQFTLYADCRRGRRPSLDAAAPPEVARALYEEVARLLADAGVPVARGVFQAHMSVELLNDGPVTILLDSSKQL